MPLLMTLQGLEVHFCNLNPFCIQIF